MIKIERNTKPFCLIKEKTIDWGEKYDEYSPMFNIILTSNNYSLEESIINLLLKQKEWNLLDDDQKLIKRKKYLLDFEKYFIYNENNCFLKLFSPKNTIDSSRE